MAAEQRYYPYGAPRQQTGDLRTAYGFTGQRRDAATALLYYGARYYDPALGRFVSADTVVPAPGEPQALNRYAYVLNNPLKHIDPTGHQLNVVTGERTDKGDTVNISLKINLITDFGPVVPELRAPDLYQMSKQWMVLHYRQEGSTYLVASYSRSAQVPAILPMQPEIKGNVSEEFRFDLADGGVDIRVKARMEIGGSAGLPGARLGIYNQVGVQSDLRTSPQLKYGLVTKLTLTPWEVAISRGKVMVGSPDYLGPAVKVGVQFDPRGGCTVMANQYEVWRAGGIPDLGSRVCGEEYSFHRVMFMHTDPEVVNLWWQYYFNGEDLKEGPQ